MQSKTVTKTPATETKRKTCHWRASDAVLARDEVEMAELWRMLNAHGCWADTEEEAAPAPRREESE